MAVLEKLLPHLNEGKPVRSFGLDKEELALLRPLFLLTAKPAMYVANVSEDGFTDNPHFDRLKALAEQENAPIVAICAAIESDIAELEDDEKAEFLAEMGMEEAGLNRLIRAGYAQVIAYDDFIALGGEAKAKEAGKMRAEGKEYIVQDGDVIHFLFNV